MEVPQGDGKAEDGKATYQELATATEQKRNVFSSLIDAVEGDLKHEGPYLFEFGYRDGNIDKRVIVLPDSKTISEGNVSVMALTWDGPKTIGLSQDEYKKLQNLEKRQTWGDKDSSKGGMFDKIITFGQSHIRDEFVRVESDNIRDLNPEEFMQAINEAKDNSPFRKELEKQNQRLEDARKLKQAYQDSIISTDAQVSPTEQDEKIEQTPQVSIPEQIKTVTAEIRKTYLSLMDAMQEENNKSNSNDKRYLFKFGNYRDNTVLVFSNNEISEDEVTITLLTPVGPKSAVLSKDKYRELQTYEQKQGWGHPDHDKGGVYDTSINLGQSNNFVSIERENIDELSTEEFMRNVNKVRPEIPNQRQKLMTKEEQEKLRQEQEKQKKLQEEQEKKDNFVKMQGERAATDTARDMLANLFKPKT
jgi:hypothetical protein